MRNEEEIQKIVSDIRQTGYQIHLYLGVGYLEKVYENALKHRLEKLGYTVSSQVPLQVYDEDGFLIGEYAADLIVNEKVIVELKAVNQLNGSHVAQLLNYLKTTGIKDGLLINFGSEKYEVKKLIL